MKHVVAIPYPAQGHINPMLQLCQQLAPLGFSFTFINTHHIHQRVERARHMSCTYQDVTDNDTHEGLGAHGHQGGDHCTVNGRDDDAEHIDAQHGEDAAPPDKYNQRSSIRMVFIAGGCPPEQHAHQSSWSHVFNAVKEMQKPVEELISGIMQEQGVAFILSDIMLGWCGSTAHKFSVPWVCFWAASAATCSALFHFSDLAKEGKCIKFAGEGAIMEGIPGLPPTNLDDLPRVWDSSTWKAELHVVLGSFEAATKEACMLVLNTFEELEGQVVEALRKRLPTEALGPLLPSHFLLHTCPDTTLLPPLSLFPEDTSCLAWLDTHPPSSVLFISFGSISLRSEQQLQELSLGVHASGCPFLWACRPGISTGFTHDDSPCTFAHENAHPSSLIIPWAPQLQVLSHPAVGGFITHCGWNSVIESVSLGVPMLCWADTGERMSNQRFVVEFWKCGVDMVPSSKRVTQHIDKAMLVGRDEVEKSVKFLMLEDAGAPIRDRAAQLKAIAGKVFEGSQSHFKEFVQVMEQKHLIRMPT